MILKHIKKRIVTSILLIFFTILIFNYNFFLLLGLIIFGIYSLIEFFDITKRIFRNQFYLLFSNISFIIYIFLFCIMFFIFSNFIQLKIILFSLLFSCIASDVGGFLIGKTLKGPKLSKISPNKTISGAIGSIIFSCSIFLILINYLTGFFDIKILSIGIITSIACQSGDLFFSFLKRKAKLKDTGSILPGHGGILDRLDGIFLGVPIGFLSLIILY